MCIKKIVSVILAMVMLLGLCMTLTVPAESGICYIGTNQSKKYNSIPEAIEAAKGEEIHLISDCTLAKGGALDYYDRKAVINGHGYTISLMNRFAINRGSDFTFKDVTFDMSASASRLTLQSTGKLTLSDKAIFKNRKGKGQGGGVEVAGQSRLIMEKGSLISDCEAEWGGGVSVANGATFEMKGGEIKNCKSTVFDKGGAVLVQKGGTLILSGNATANKGNYSAQKEENIMLESGSNFVLGGQFVGDVGVMTVESSFGQVLSGAAGAENIFFDLDHNKVGLATGGKIVWIKKSEAKATVDKASQGSSIQTGTNETQSTTGTSSVSEKDICYIGANQNKKYNSIPEAIEAAKGEEIHLLSDCYLAKDGALDYYDKKALINGHGHTIYLMNRFAVNRGSDFTFKDVTVDMSTGSGRITLQSTGKLTLSDKATVKNRKGKGQGGGVEVAGQSRLIMEKGSLISDCEAEWGGGVSIANGATFEMKGGEIKNCKASAADKGGAILVQSGGTLIISGDAKVTDGNKAVATAQNIKILDGGNLILSGAFEGSVKISSSANMAGATFGKAEAGSSGAEKILSDTSASVKGNIKDGELYWYSEDMGKYLDRKGWVVTANSQCNDARKISAIVDGNADTFWHSWYTDEKGVEKKKDDLPYIIDIELPEKSAVAGFNILNRHQNSAGWVLAVNVYGFIDGEYKLLAQRKYVTEQLILDVPFFNAVEVSKVRIEIVDSMHGYGTMAEFNLMLPKEGMAVLPYDEFIQKEAENALYPLDKSNFSASFGGVNWGSHTPAEMLDGSNSTYWQADTSEKAPWTFEVTFDDIYEVKAFDYLPRQANYYDGYWLKYKVYSTVDGNEYTEVLSGEHAVEDRHLGIHHFDFGKTVEASGFRFEILSGMGNLGSCAELDFYEGYESYNKRVIEGREEYVLTIGNKEIRSNKGNVNLDVEPYIENGTTFIPLRGLLELMGAEILWDGETQTITVNKGKTEIKLQVRYKNVYVTNPRLGTNRYTLMEEPRIVNSRTFIPIRFVSEQLGYNVSWNGETREVTIDNK